MNRRHHLARLASLGALSAAMPGYALGASAPAADGQQRALTGWVADPRFDLPAFGPRHPEQPRRVQAIQAALAREPVLASRVERLAMPSDAAIEEAIARIHTPAHVEGIRSRYDREINTLARAAVGGALASVEAVHARRIVNAFAAVRPPGHHAANTGREEGFGFFNTISVAARHVQRRLGYARVLIIDWDYHHGDGTEALFYDDPSVFYFSTFDPDAYPGTGSALRTGSGAGTGFTANHPLRCGATDEDVLAIYRDHLIPVADRFRPEFVLVSAGFDSRVDDLLGCFRFTDDGYRRMTGVVCDIARRHCAGRLVSCLEGGYNVAGLASAAMAHTAALVQAAAAMPR
jgi:acetoin utilization deacetylase AcuC-like enzyme